ncbi:MAG TPA: peptidylprolyl isomerase [Thermoanaerobaculia bacterium]|jgi:cyclophilin family peptidyl-prolyl cis-trans isomerase|nr:peptidylprolyl isomerase [Thermoanaerobaculia bacterium]
MNGILASFVCLLAIAAPAAPQASKAPKPAPKAQAAQKPAANPRVLLDTTKGKIVLELYPAKAPKTVKNFLDYVKAGQYNGVIFHRVIPGFMVQGGGFTPDMKEKPTRAPIPNEADNGLSNDRGTIAMARTADPNSASAQFFINVADNTPLNHTSKTPQGWGYAVFGRVVEGMEVADAIVAVPTTTKGLYENVPLEPVVIRKASIVGAGAPAKKK